MKRHFIIYWLPVLTYATLIFLVSGQSHPEEYVQIRVWDKLVHVVEYAILGCLCYRAFRYAGGPTLTAKAISAAIVASSLYGVADEVHQLFIPMREASVHDAIADVVGSISGVLLYRLASSTAITASSVITVLAVAITALWH